MADGDSLGRNFMDYTVKQITYKEAKPWILYMHYAKRLPNIMYAFGLFENEELKGVCTFGSPASPQLCSGICGIENKDKVIELNRLVLSENLMKNTASYFISRCIKMLPPERIIVSYADTKMHHIGYIYQATNWIYTGSTKPRTDISSGNNRHGRHYKKGDVERVKRSVKHRYVYFHKCSKEIIESLRYEILPYPKGDNQRYIIGKIDDGNEDIKCKKKLFRTFKTMIKNND